MKRIEADLTDEQYEALMWFGRGDTHVPEAFRNLAETFQLLHAIAKQQPEPPRPIKRGDIVLHSTEIGFYSVRWVDNDGTCTLRRIDAGYLRHGHVDNLTVRVDLAPKQGTTWLDANPLEGQT